MMLMTQTQKPKPRPMRVELLAELLELFSEEEIAQFARLARQARECSGGNNAGMGMFADVKIRWKGRQPRFMGVELWEETEK